MTDHEEEQLATPAPTPQEIHVYVQYVHPLRAIFESLHYDLSTGGYPTVPPPLRSLCLTARQHVYSISQNTTNIMEAVAYTLRLLRLVKVEELDAKLATWHELRIQQKFRAYLEHLGGEIKLPKVSIEDRVCVLLGLLIDPLDKDSTWVDAENRNGWKELVEEYGNLGNDFYEAGKTILECENAFERLQAVHSGR